MDVEVMTFPLEGDGHRSGGEQWVGLHSYLGDAVAPEHRSDPAGIGVLANVVRERDRPAQSCKVRGDVDR